MRLPTYRELRRFVEVEGWEDKDKDKASGRKKGDHHRYVLTTPTGGRLMTRISHGRGQVADPGLFAHILRDQLDVTEDQFWAAVDDGKPPERPQPEGHRPEGPAIDGKLARNLIVKVGLTHDELVGMTQDDAVRTWTTWLTTGERPPPP
jgi:hypothetical protein